MTQRRDKHASLAHARPGEPTSVSDEDVRLGAYRKWEAAGKPTGDGIQFWLAAEQELVVDAATNADDVHRGGGYVQREHDRPEPEKAATGNVDSHYRDENRMFQRHGERGHRHGGGG